MDDNAAIAVFLSNNQLRPEVNKQKAVCLRRENGF